MSEQEIRIGRAGTMPGLKPELQRAMLALLLLAPAVLLLVNVKPLLAQVYFAALAGVLLVSLPRVTFVLFVLSIGLYLPYMINNFALLPFDILLVILFFSTLLGFFMRGNTEIRGGGVDLAFLLLIGATVISAIFAHDPSYSILPTVRIFLIYLAYRMVFKYSLDMSVRGIVQLYLFIVFALSVVNGTTFLVAGGEERIFGPAWLAYETFAMTGLPMALAFLIWAETPADRFKYVLVAVVIGFGLLASGSRAPLLAVILAVPVLLVFGWRKSRRERSVSSMRVLRGLMIPIAALVVMVVLLRETIFMGALERMESLVESIENPQETVLLRLVLAKAAVKGFLADPLTGIGIGNFKIVDRVAPEMRMEPVWFYIRGMSAHNVVLHYLAETGIPGTLALLLLAFSGLRLSYRTFRMRLTARENQVSASLFVAMVVFCVTLFYMRAWTWGQSGYVLSLLFGLTAAWHYRVRRTTTRVHD